MYTKDMSYHLTLRLSETEYQFLLYHADLCGMSVSAYVRSIINTIRLKKLEAISIENKQADKHYKL